MKSKFFLPKNKKGFALLFSVLLSSFLLLVGLSIFGIALKELSLSTAARQSIHAFFAADSGRECLIYWDIKKGQVPTLVDSSSPGNTGGSIVCGLSGVLNLSRQTNPNRADTSLSDIILFADGSDGPNFSIDVVKLPTASGGIETTVSVRGYDLSGDNKLERAIEQTY